jgi:DNA-binding NarL/FixJ family response regulator
MAGPQRIRVAIVEDDPETRARLTRSFLADAELEACGDYATAGAALTGLARAVPDVLLVDLGLPDMHGLELIRIVARQYPGCEILVFTAFGDEATVLACLDAGAHGYLLKGHLSHEISMDVRDIKAGGSPLSPLIARHLLKRTENPKQAADDPLSPREREILDTIARGFTYAETAKLLGIGAATVHTHLKRIYRKLAVSSKTEAIFEASRLNLL